MKTSENGLKIIKDFEGYMRALPDGRCQAYRCVVGHRGGAPIYDGKWTIGWGCTHNITEGMIWTREQAEAALRQEVAEDGEAPIAHHVTVELNQNEYDALSSFGYNVGEGHFASSTLVRRLNAGDRRGAADQFAVWTNSNGVHNVPGLVSRRARERALFLTPCAAEAPIATSPAPETADEMPGMPQTIDPPAQAEVHADAHADLMRDSWMYYLNRINIKAILPAAAAGIAWAQEHAVEIGIVALVLVMLLEGIQYEIRTRKIET